MTEPTTTAPAHVTRRAPVGLRAVVSVLETAAFIAGTTLATMNNGQDFRHAIVLALLGFTAHGVNHNVGGSPV